jgi:hypothetical protein
MIWFDPSALLGYSHVVFMPDIIVTYIWNQDLCALYDEAQLFGVTDGCTGFHSYTTIKLCKTILEGNLMEELASVNFFYHLLPQQHRQQSCHLCKCSRVSLLKSLCPIVHRGI